MRIAEGSDRRLSGRTAELPVLQNLLDEVEGGFLRKDKIDKSLVQQLKETIQSLTLSEHVIESNVSLELPSDKPRKLRRPPEDDEITILGTNYGIDGLCKCLYNLTKILLCIIYK